ncbi:hypothetical protein HanXRQr2_Chr15g0693171 [Helianthus annuus]|nr:hypothetical protein HanXRQr2_Chr15g0693171 [Helianthus annuus]KAJ0831265.1 hypothetical protein HanPSC8_Chr15g0665081 [Helianthus annuus]
MDFLFRSINERRVSLLVGSDLGLCLFVFQFVSSITKHHHPPPHHQQPPPHQPPTTTTLPDRHHPAITTIQPSPPSQPLKPNIQW